MTIKITVPISSLIPQGPWERNIGLTGAIKRATQNTIRSSGPSTYQIKPLQSVKKPFALKVSRGFSMGA